MIDRRTFLAVSAGALVAGSFGSGPMSPDVIAAAPRLRVTGLDILPIRATARTVWLFIRLRTDAGLTGLGEASDAFGFANTSKQDAGRMEAELRKFFALIEGKSPLEIAAFRHRGEPLARGRGLMAATAYSAIEQALWDLAGKALEVPSYSLFGGKLRDELPVYANVNRATNPRTPGGFAATAKAAVREGFRAVKAAPFDGFPAPGSPAAAIESAVETGIASVAAMREAIGPDVELMIDCHSFFDVSLAERVARRLEPQKLSWYEEPVPPERVEDTLEIRRRIQQPMAGGEILFGLAGFAPLCRARAVHVIMPDVKHCGGLLELTRIAAMAQAEDITVAPHNPSGPVSTAASVQVCAVLTNFRILELQWGEVGWRHEVVRPDETFVRGTIRVPDAPGFGIDLNDSSVKAHPL
jgi:galactonate dehydratase